MGTHPIFESDFDCLTDFFEIWGVVLLKKIPIIQQNGMQK